MPANIGSQTISIKFFDPVDSFIVNRLGKETRRLGIYSGGYLTRVTDASVSLSPLICEIGDGTYQIRGETGVAVAVTVSSALPYVVLRWLYTGSATADYMDFVAVALGSILTTDIVVGKCTYAGLTLTGFDYALRTNPNVMDLFLKVEPLETPAMRVMVRSGRVSYGSSNKDVAVQQSPLFTAPGSNSRIDLVQVDTSGAIVITQGATSASPVPPDYAGLITLAEVTLAVGQTTIIASNIKDVRSFVAATSANAVLTTGDQVVAGVKTFTSFPVTPGSAPTTNYQAANKKYVDDQDALRVAVADLPSNTSLGVSWLSGTEYTNNTGHKILIVILATEGYGGGWYNCEVTCYIGPSSANTVVAGCKSTQGDTTRGGAGAYWKHTMSFVVPNGWKWQFTNTIPAGGGSWAYASINRIEVWEI